jgi:hypothetical protein
LRALLARRQHPRHAAPARIGDRGGARILNDDHLDVPIPPLVHEPVAASAQGCARRRVERGVRLLEERVGRQELVVNARRRDGRLEGQVEIVPVGQYLEYRRRDA